MKAMENPGDNPSFSRAFGRGLIGRCPKCGRGKLFGHFLKVEPACTACLEPFHHHRADDFPAYVVIFLAGHIVLPSLFYVEVTFAPPTWVQMAIWLPVTLGLCLALLQPVKGAIVALQWSVGMHGFDDAKKVREGAQARA
jgi:uncharacterized protein (DUF983 family)